ncbi:MAG: bifunctional tetrahydrofolate synthase/dihydrofolate synthase [Steroidobacteraceae bacterium]|nr:bifunctional tetrahydrofolate synthase/dihydrofolate synthase [Steroidobacteraceae bacterium]
MRSLADWLERQQKSHPKAIDLTLARVHDVGLALGLIDPAYPVITVAGTNGKGSTVAYLDSLLRALGKRTGRFTSPHLRRYNERICIDGVEATDAELIGCFERIDSMRADVTLTFFEYNALAALDHFRERGVEVAVLEVGLGGRLDATNIVDADVGVVCSIGMDHADWLGDTLEEIGREKAGIFRRGRPAVLASANLPASVATVADEVGAVTITADRDYHVSEHDGGWDFELGAVRLAGLARPTIPGKHQIGNAAAALAALVAAGFGGHLSSTLVSAALRATRLDGRFQIVSGPVEWILDVAHNVPAAEGLSANLRARPRARRTIAVCAILGDKDILGITATLLHEIDVWILAALEGPRAVSTRDLAARLPADAVVHAQSADVSSACRTARDLAQPGDRVVVFGSFLTVGPALDFLGL